MRAYQPTSAAYRRGHALASWFDHPGDFFGRGKDHRGPVAHHPGRRDRGRPFFRPVLTGVCLESLVAFPEGPCLAFVSRNAVGVVAIGDGLDLLAWLAFFRVRLASTAYLASHLHDHYFLSIPLHCLLR